MKREVNPLREIASPLARPYPHMLAVTGRQMAYPPNHEDLLKHVPIVYRPDRAGLL